tara:strand:+ start:277 stop:378 length:102 start_codon:yes stop_codon:yes gene_type:complete
MDILDQFGAEIARRDEPFEVLTNPEKYTFILAS